jgi:hypothetical protein
MIPLSPIFVMDIDGGYQRSGHIDTCTLVQGRIDTGVTSSANAAYTFTDLGTLGGTSGFATAIYKLSRFNWFLNPKPIHVGWAWGFLA